MQGADLSRDEALHLAAAARDDPAALAELRSAATIDGEPADLGRALAADDADQLDARLDALEGALGRGGTGGDAGAARDRAAEIVDGYRDAEGPGAQTIEVGEGGSPGGLDVDLGIDLGALWLPLLIAAGLVGALLALRAVRRREANAYEAAVESGEERPSEPLSELERQARDAEERGDYETVLRIRYGIALAELQSAGRVPRGPAVTAARVARELADPRADRLVGTFEGVAYGGRPAGPDEAREARETWPALTGAQPGSEDS